VSKMQSVDWHRQQVLHAMESLENKLESAKNSVHQIRERQNERSWRADETLSQKTEAIAEVVMNMIPSLGLHRLQAAVVALAEAESLVAIAAAKLQTQPEYVKAQALSDYDALRSAG
jgi:hypothetical protein